jgi:uncharacterized HAD superfamily protein
MVIYVDVDETICQTPSDRNYSNSTPIVENIEKINRLYDKGHTIIYWTARGTITKIDWSEITKEQFRKWSVKFHELKFEKPHYDIFICDKAINSLDFFKSQI